MPDPRITYTIEREPPRGPYLWVHTGCPGPKYQTNTEEWDLGSGTQSVCQDLVGASIEYGLKGPSKILQHVAGARKAS